MADCNTCSQYMSVEDILRRSIKCDANGNVALNGGLLNYYGDYVDKLKGLFGTDIIALYPMQETSGTVVNDESAENNDAAYSGTVVLNQEGFGLNKAVNFNGIGCINAYSAGLAADFNGNEGYLSLWLKAKTDAAWIDNLKYLFSFINSTNRLMCRNNSSTSHRLSLFIYRNSVVNDINIGALAGTRWINLGFRWTATKLDTFINGILHKSFTISGAWSAPIEASYSYLLAHANDNEFSGMACYATLLKAAPTDAAIRSTVDCKGIIMYEGDSRTNIKRWCSIAADKIVKDTTFAFSGYSICNESVAGSGTILLNARKAATNAKRLTDKPSVLVLWIGVNDLVMGAQAIYNNIKAYCIDARTAGWNKIILCTEIDAQHDMSWHNTVYPALNALIAADHSFVDAVADLGARAELQNALDTTYYDADKIHLNEVGYAVVGEVVGNVLATII